MIVAYVSSDRQLADPLTKPTSALINSTVFPQWGLVGFFVSPEGERVYFLLSAVGLSRRYPRTGLTVI